MDKKLNDYRVFPRLMMAFMMYMMVEFHIWFTQNGDITVLDLSEWALVGYASVMATFVGFAKYYMDSGSRSTSAYVDECDKPKHTIHKYPLKYK